MKGSTLVHRLLAQAVRQLDEGIPLRVHVRVGALTNISPGSLQRHFARAASGSPLDGVDLVVHTATDPLAPDALAVRVTGVDRAA